MAEKSSQYTYPVHSVVLPKRLHCFLAYHIADPVSDATTRQYHQIIEVFHPKLALPLDLGKDVVMRIFQITVLPFLRRQNFFDKDTCVFSYISTNAQPELKPDPTQTLVLPQNLIKFMCIHDDPDMVVEASSEEYHKIIDLFFPTLQLPQKKFDRETLISIFDIIVLPFFHRLEEFDKDSGFIRYLTLEVLPRKPKDFPIETVTLPVGLHSFLAFVDPKVVVLAGPTDQQINQIIAVFHPTLDIFWDCNGRHENHMMGLFNLFVLPYFRNIISFNYQDNTMTYYAIDL